MTLSGKNGKQHGEGIYVNIETNDEIHGVWNKGEQVKTMKNNPGSFGPGRGSGSFGKSGRDSLNSQNNTSIAKKDKFLKKNQAAGGEFSFNSFGKGYSSNTSFGNYNQSVKQSGKILAQKPEEY